VVHAVSKDTSGHIVFIYKQKINARHLVSYTLTAGMHLSTTDG